MINKISKKGEHLSEEGDKNKYDERLKYLQSREIVNGIEKIYLVVRHKGKQQITSDNQKPEVWVDIIDKKEGIYKSFRLINFEVETAHCKGYYEEPIEEYGANTRSWDFWIVPNDPQIHKLLDKYVILSSLNGEDE